MYQKVQLEWNKSQSSGRVRERELRPQEVSLESLFLTVDARSGFTFVSDFLQPLVLFDLTKSERTTTGDPGSSMKDSFYWSLHFWGSKSFTLIEIMNRIDSLDEITFFSFSFSFLFSFTFQAQSSMEVQLLPSSHPVFRLCFLSILNPFTL